MSEPTLPASFPFRLRDVVWSIRTEETVCPHCRQISTEHGLTWHVSGPQEIRSITHIEEVKRGTEEEVETAVVVRLEFGGPLFDWQLFKSRRAAVLRSDELNQEILQAQEARRNPNKDQK